VELSHSHNFFSGSDNEEERKKDKESEVKLPEHKIDTKDIPDKNTAFNIFKQEYMPVKEFEANIAEASNGLKKNKEEAKQLLETCNEIKKRIEDIRKRLEDKKLAKINEGVIFFNTGGYGDDN
jgi:hypothetical protein